MSGVRVVFMGGYGRSGSTVLDLLLDRVPGITAVGEFRHLFGRALGDDELCSCGVPFGDCPFWREVVATAFPDGYDRRRIQEAVEAFNRVVALPRIERPALRRRLTREQARTYRQGFVAAYGAVAAVSGASVIVDSTKYPMHGLFLGTLPELDLAGLLLVRDPRAVAHSWQRRRLRPEVHWEEREMPRHSVVRSALAWNLSNRLTERLRGSVSEFRVQRYEDFVASPASQLRELASFVAGEPTDVGPEVFGPPSQVSHTIAGNPVRLGGGAVEITPDERWRNEMPRSKQVLVSALCTPRMRRYGYPLLP